MEKTILSLLFSLITSSAPQKQEWHRGEAIEQFGPEVSERSACMVAENKAIFSVVRQVAGEAVSTSQYQLCNESNEEVCQMLISSTSYTDGMVTGLRKLSTEVSGSGIRSCKVAVEVGVTKDSGKSDVSFDPEIRVSKTQLREGEFFKVIVNPNQPVFLNLFYFSPYLERHEQVQFLYQSERIITSKIELPENPLIFLATFPKAKVDGGIAGEVMIAVATKRPISFRKTFSLSEFNQRIQEIPKSERRIVRMPYLVWAKDKSHKLQ
jgi:hypothetical protein